jgi:glutamyl-tRNA synthetase
LRIEDTDTARNRREHVEGIMSSLRWLGLSWDEGPYLQSERSGLYERAIDVLLEKGAVYACDCTPADIQERARKRKGPPGYDGFCRDRDLGATSGRMLRFKTPREGSIGFTDLVRGNPTFPLGAIEDFGVRKSNGEPLFILANVVDDADMSISHVIRGDDHTSNTPKYALLWDVLGYGELPVFAHLPLINNAQGKKLSKRRDKVSVEDFRDEGYLPEAMVNYLALLGWSPGDDREILALEEMISEFDLADVKSSPAIFDERKLASVNSQYLRKMTPEELVERSELWLRSRWEPLAPLVQERVRTLAEVFSMVEFLYRPELVIDQAEWDKAIRKNASFALVLEAAADSLADAEWDVDGIHSALSAAGDKAGGASLRDSQAPVRLAVTGRSVGPPLMESLVLLGRDKTLGRIRTGLERVRHAPGTG